jgi:aconitate hydratase
LITEYGATAAFFPPDDTSISYLEKTNRDLDTIDVIDTYLVASGLKRDYSDSSQDPTFSTVVELDLSTVVPSCSGPKRPHDKVAVQDMKVDFNSCLTSPVGFKVVFHFFPV